MASSSSTTYQVHGNMVEHLTEPRFQALVHCRDGLCFTIEDVEWVDSPGELTPEHQHFLLSLAMLAWASKHGQLQ